MHGAAAGRLSRFSVKASRLDALKTDAGDIVEKDGGLDIPAGLAGGVHQDLEEDVALSVAAADLMQIAANRPEEIDDAVAKSKVLHARANVAGWLDGRPRDAVPLFRASTDIASTVGRRPATAAASASSR